jgi:hypothetical protein
LLASNKNSIGVEIRLCEVEQLQKKLADKNLSENDRVRIMEEIDSLFENNANID